MKKERILLIGGGGHCKSCIDVIEQTKKYEIIGIIDVKEKKGQKILNYPIIGSDDDIVTLSDDADSFLLTIGQIGLPKRRKEIFNELKSKGIKFATVISPLAYVSKYATLGEGTIVMHHAIVNVDVNIGENCIINSKCLVEHDVTIGNHCHISTGAIVNGGVKIGNEVFYGSGAVSKHGIEVPDNSFIKANSRII